MAPIGVEPISLRSSFPDAVSVEFPEEGRRAEDGGRPDTGPVTGPRRHHHGPAGGQVPLAHPPGPVLVTVVAGELSCVDADDCEERAHPEGSAFLDPGHGSFRTVSGSIPDVTRLVATSLDVPATGP